MISTSLEGKKLAVTINEDVISTSVDRLHGEILEQMNNNKAWDELHVDLTKTGRVDSMGINMLVMILSETKRRGAIMSAAVLEGMVYDALLFTRLDRQIKLTVKR
ncbi:MAG: hypothetical protein PHV34_00640 [Verrucomicrobiae bacterium]|nr:hypothetical protein [Verrucomicrobiae bacterium]